jgi:hypothetical protein
MHLPTIDIPMDVDAFTKKKYMVIWEHYREISTSLVEHLAPVPTNALRDSEKFISDEIDNTKNEDDWCDWIILKYPEFTREMLTEVILLHRYSDLSPDISESIGFPLAIKIVDNTLIIPEPFNLNIKLVDMEITADPNSRSSGIVMMTDGAFEIEIPEMAIHDNSYTPTGSWEIPTDDHNTAVDQLAIALETHVNGSAIIPDVVVKAYLTQNEPGDTYGICVFNTTTSTGVELETYKNNIDDFFRDALRKQNVIYDVRTNLITQHDDDTIIDIGKNKGDVVSSNFLLECVISFKEDIKDNVPCLSKSF